MKKLKKKYLLTLLVIIIALGVYLIKNDGSSSKSIQVDKDNKFVEGEYYGEEGCDAVFSALKIRTVEKEVKQGEQPTSYELTCTPDPEAIKIITGDENGSVKFKVNKTNFEGSDTFTCKKGGNNEEYKLIEKNKASSFTIVPQDTFTIPKSKDSKETYTCMKIPTEEYGYINISIQEYVGGLPGGKTQMQGSLSLPVQIQNATISSIANTSKGDNPNEHVEQNNPLVDTSLKNVQRNKYLLNYTTDYSSGKNASKTFNEYYSNWKNWTANRKYEANVTGDGENAKVTNIRRGDGASIKGNINLSCNFNLTEEDIAQIKAHNFNDTYKDGKMTEYYYDQKNTNYFYAQQEEPIPPVYYKWHINVGSRDQSAIPRGKVSCKRVCQEVVKVEYGPPVAVQAGMCFEYRVKVSSIVNCGLKDNSLTNDDINSSIPGVCIPEPWCWSNVHHKVYKIAGPTEDYDNCIKDCDGGKYTESCSNKCYEKIYDNTEENNQITNNNKYINPSFINNYQSNCVDGMYYRSGNSINWCVFNFQMDGLRVDAPGNASYFSSNALNARAAIWYHKFNYSWPAYSNKYQVSSSTYVDNAAGIIRGRYKQDGTVQECHDGCHWITNGCNNNYIYFDYYYYQNQCKNGVVKRGCATETICKTYKELTGISLKDSSGKERRVCTSDELRKLDAEQNKKAQEEAIKKCAAVTTCHRTQSEYRIQLNVALKDTKGNSEIIKVNPYSENNKLRNGDNQPKNIETTALLSYGGCYAHNGTNNRWYQSEWTVPGTWISYKGKVSYDPSNKPKSSWGFIKGKVCIPSDVKPTNSEWAYEFNSLVNQLKNGKVNRNINLKEKFDNNGKQYTAKATSTNSTAYPIEAYDNNEKEYTGYNIFANSTNFGHFRWNFTISCFWAYTDSEPGCVGDQCTEGCENGECDCQKTNSCRTEKNKDYTTRSFNEDDVLLTGQKVQYRKLDVTNLRDNIPFNWSQSATMTYMKWGGYNENPYTDVLKRIENTNTFDNSNADYVITINQTQINNIRKYNSNQGRADNGYAFNGTYASQNGVIVYTSPLLGKSEYMTKIRGYDLSRMRGKNNRKYY